MIFRPVMLRPKKIQHIFWNDENMRIPILDDLEELVEKQSLTTNRRLVSLLLDKYYLLGHCAAIKRYLLLAQGDLIEVKICGTILNFFHSKGMETAWSASDGC